jgi:hypothetical protein
MQFFAQISWQFSPLISVVDFEPKNFGNKPQKTRKEEQIRNQNQLFHGINNWNFGPEIARDFERPKLRVLQKKKKHTKPLPKFWLSENRRNFRRAKMNYCVRRQKKTDFHVSKTTKSEFFFMRN